MRNAVKLALTGDEQFTTAVAAVADARRAELAALSQLHRVCDRIRKQTSDELVAQQALEATQGLAEESDESAQRLGRTISVLEAAQLAARARRA